MDVKHVIQCLAHTSSWIFKKLHTFLHVGLAFWWGPNIRDQALVSTRAWVKVLVGARTSQCLPLRGSVDLVASPSCHQDRCWHGPGTLVGC